MTAEHAIITSNSAAPISSSAGDTRGAPGSLFPEKRERFFVRAAERMNLESARGAGGTTIFWKQVGQSSWVPLLLESAVICWPHTGQANLNSLIRCAHSSTGRR